MKNIINVIEKPEIIDNIGQSLESIGRFCDYMLHPTKILLNIWDFTVSSSRIVLVIACIGGYIMYITTDSKKAKIVTLGSPTLYFLIKALDSVLKEVL